MTVAPPTPADPDTVHVDGGVTVNANVFAAPLAEAVRVTLCAEVTAAAIAVNVALDDPDATVTLAGTVTLALLLESATATPPLGAGALSETVQESDAGPATLPDAHVRPVSVEVREIEPPLPEAEMVEPAGFEITTGLSATEIEESGALEETFNVAEAMVPLLMAF